MIPRSIEKLEPMGCSEETAGLVLPTGFSFNTDGTAMAVLFIAQALDIELSLGQQLMMLFVMLSTSKGRRGSPAPASSRWPRPCLRSESCRRRA